MSTATGPVFDLSALGPREFVDAAYHTILGRPPTAQERDQMLTSLLRGDTRTWLLGTLRFGPEGRRRSVTVPGLRVRYLAQQLFRTPGIGPVLEWISAVIKLPLSLRAIRANQQLDADLRERMRDDVVGRIVAVESGSKTLARDVALVHELTQRGEGMQVEISALRTFAADAARRDEQFNDRIDRLDLQIAPLVAEVDRLRAAVAHGDERSRQFDEQAQGLREEFDRLRSDALALAHSLSEVQKRVDALFPPSLNDMLEVPGAPLLPKARERSGVAPGRPIASLSPAVRYAMFEAVFYESAAVAAKQRIYVSYLGDSIFRRLPFLDLGCGRGELLRILRGEGINAIGVDINPAALDGLRADGFEVVERDLLDFLMNDQRTYSGASLLQVAEHLTPDQIERTLELVFARLAPGGLFILETPNPLSPFALAHFHTDPTHLAPLPPERTRYAIEAAGFENTRTLFQARIPGDQFAGPDPRAYYADYAIIASRPLVNRQEESGEAPNDAEAD